MLYGNPWIFRDILSYLKDGKIEEKPTPNEKLSIMKQHIELLVKQKGEDIGIKEMRKHIAWYTKNLKDATTLRQKVNTITNKEELLRLLTLNVIK